MIKRTRSTPRPKLESAPSKSEPINLPPVSVYESPSSPKKNQKLVINNYMSHKKHRSMDCSFEPITEIENLHNLCNQLIKGQEELKERLQKQEAIIEQLRAENKLSKTKPVIPEVVQGRRPESFVRRLPAFTPRGSEESGFFTFRPSETEKQKVKFPRDIFSRKSRVRPNKE